MSLASSSKRKLFASGPTGLTLIGQAGAPNTNLYGTQSVISNILLIVINYVFFFVSIGAVFFLILYSIRYISSNGDAEKAKKARSGIIGAVIGVALAVASYTIINFSNGLGGLFYQSITATPTPTATP